MTQDNINNVVIDSFERLLMDHHSLAHARQAYTIEDSEQQLLWAELVDGGWVDIDFLSLCQQSDDVLLRVSELSGSYLLSLPFICSAFMMPSLFEVLPQLVDQPNYDQTRPISIGIGDVSQSELWFNYYGKAALYGWLSPQEHGTGFKLQFYEPESLIIQKSLDPTVAIASPTTPAYLTYVLGQELEKTVIPVYLTAQLAHLIGAAYASLDLAICYAKERCQFGTAIGSFQGVKHSLVDAWVAVDNARYALKAVSSAISQSEDTKRLLMA